MYSKIGCDSICCPNPKNASKDKRKALRSKVKSLEACEGRGGNDGHERTSRLRFAPKAKNPA